MPHILEFMGLPAAGKSTLAAALRNKACQNGIRLSGEDAAFREAARREARGILQTILVRLPRKLCETLAGPMRRLDALHLYMTKNPAFFAEGFRMVEHALPSTVERQSFLYAVLRQCALREVIGSYLPAQTSVLVEEGFAHRAMTLFGYRLWEMIPEADLAAYLESMPKPDALVWVDTSPAVCAQRLRERKQPPIAMQAIPPSEWESCLNRAEMILNRVATGLQMRGVEVLRISGDDGRPPPSDALSPVLQWLLAQSAASA